MDRRRALAQRPASSEEVECWAHASSALNACCETYNNPSTRDAMERVNRSLLAWPTGSDNGEPLEAFETVKDTYKKLSSGLTDVKEQAEAEAKIIDSALEALSVIMAVRRAPETATSQEKRNKRTRGSSPLSAPSTPVPNSVNKITLNVKAEKDRSSEGPTSQPQVSKGDAKLKNKFYAKQLPLQEGRKVAFHPPSTGEQDENDWILAVVTRCVNQERHKYEVLDVEPQEAGQPGQRYTANLKTMVPLPDPTAPMGNPAHPNSCPVFNAGTVVMALYPDTSCFYRAVVTEVLREGRAPTVKLAYRVKFEDDDDQTHTVAAQWVVEWPGT